jgi:hypothetical protein
MWKPKYAENRRKKYRASKSEREKRKKQGRTSEENKKYMQKYYAENKEGWNNKTTEQKKQYLANRRKRYASDPEYRKKILEEVKQYHKKNPLAKKKQSLKNLYGLSLEKFDELLAKQNNSCAICGIKNNGDKKLFPFVDHCHTTNKIRGLLCINCNQALGKFKDDIQFLKNAIKYLEANK